MKKRIEFFKKYLSKGNLENFNSNNIFIGSELAFNLNLKEGDSFKFNVFSFCCNTIRKFTKTRKF